MIWLPPPLLSPSRLSLFPSFPVGSLAELTDGERGDGGGAKSNDREKAWSSINHSIVTGTTQPLMTKYPEDIPKRRYKIIIK
jgi:hypothetical protein